MLSACLHVLFHVRVVQAFLHAFVHAFCTLSEDFLHAFMRTFCPLSCLLPFWLSAFHARCHARFREQFQACLHACSMRHVACHAAPQMRRGIVVILAMHGRISLECIASFMHACTCLLLPIQFALNWQLAHGSGGLGSDCQNLPSR